MKTFEDFLFQRGFNKSTVRKYRSIIEKFEYWLEKENIKVRQARYNDFLAYISLLKKRKNSTGTINRKLSALRHYFNFLLELKKVETNPLIGIFLKGEKRRIPHNLLTEEELNEIYENLKEETLLDKRDRVIVGFLVFVGITPQEIGRITINDLNLKKGTVYIKSGKRYNERELKLETVQILSLVEYLSEVRPRFLEQYKITSEKLFISKKNNLSFIVQGLLERLRNQYENIDNLSQLRSSVITNWLTKENLRIVQYKAGHKYVSSTERYKANNIQQLKRVVEEFHPLSCINVDK